MSKVKILWLFDALCNLILAVFGLKVRLANSGSGKPLTTRDFNWGESLKIKCPDATRQ